MTKKKKLSPEIIDLSQSDDHANDSSHITVIDVDDPSPTSSPMTPATSSAAASSSAPRTGPIYIVEKAKSGRALCKVCDEKIPNGDIRIGVIIEGEWGLFTRWQHLPCTVFHSSLQSAEHIDGIQMMDPSEQIAIADRVIATRNEVDVDSVAVDPDALIRVEWSSPLPTPFDMVLPLMKFQEEGLGWMVNQEQTNSLGGILADEMGMGKTMQSIALLLTNKSPPLFAPYPSFRPIAASPAAVEPDAAATAKSTKSKTRQTGTNARSRKAKGGALEKMEDSLVSMSTSSGSITSCEGSPVDLMLRRWLEADMAHYLADHGGIQAPAEEASSSSSQFSCINRMQANALNGWIPLPRGGTLIVVPTVALRQWQSEIVRFSKPGSLTVGIYHGDTRECGVEWLQQFNVILTTYKILEIEYRKATAGAKVTCRICGRKFYPEKLRVHRKYFCGASAQLTTAQARTERKQIRTNSSSSSRVIDLDDDSDDSGREDDGLSVSEDAEAVRRSRKGGVSSAKSKRFNDNEKILKSNRKVSESPVVTPVRNGKTSASKSRDLLSSSAAKTEATRKVASSAKKQATPENSTSSRRISRSNSKPLVIDTADDGDDSSDEDYIGSSNHSETDDDDDSDDSDDSDFIVKPRGKKLASKRVTASSKQSRGTSSSKKVLKKKSFDSDYCSSDDDTAIGSNKKRGRSNSPVKAEKHFARESTPVSRHLKKGSSSSVAKKSFSSGKGKGDDEDYVDSGADSGDQKTSQRKASGSAKRNKSPMGDSDEDSEVERDIAEAMKLHSKNITKLSLLHSVCWFRVMLDEAHMIKDRSTSTAKAVFNLSSLFKWCLTGTPLQNRVGELYSLVRFLRIDPHAYYYCKSKKCTCKSLHYRFTKGRCQDCDHSVMLHYCHFNKHILNPIKRCGYIAEGRKAMLKLKEQVLDEILLRRTKITRADDIQLPARIVRVRRDKLDTYEEDFYQALYTQSQAQFNTYVQAGTVLNNYAHIFDILIRLRQAVVHPYLVIMNDSRESEQNQLFGNSTATESNDVEQVPDCQLCNNPGEDWIRAGCGHGFCRSCITEYLDTIFAASASASSTSAGAVPQSSSVRDRRKPPAPAAVCPVCQEPISIDLSGPSTDVIVEPSHKANDTGRSSRSTTRLADSPDGSLAGRTSSIYQSDTPMGIPEDARNFQDSDRWLPPVVAESVWDGRIRRRRSILDKIDLSNFKSSTKMEALLEELDNMTTTEPNGKAIVFSQFVNMLELLDYRLQIAGYRCVKLLGSMNVAQRDEAIQKFKTDPRIKVMLISLKAGGVALNLTVANRIFLMDPWWNPAAEMQAIDRTHRIGQHKPIIATRFVIENSIEDRILMLQEKKKLVFDGTVGGDAVSIARLSVDDIRFLFQ